MRAVNEITDRLGLTRVFKLDPQPSSHERSIVTLSDDVFGYFIGKACIYLVEAHRSGVKTLPERFIEGKTVIDEIRILRNYFFHIPDDKGTGTTKAEKVADIYHKRLHKRTIKAAKDYSTLQVGLLNDTLYWVRSIREHFTESD